MVSSNPKIKNVHVFGGGTVAYISDHFAISAPSYGTTARTIAKLCEQRFPDCNIHLELTNMALGGHGPINTIEDMSKRLDQLIEDKNTRVIFFSSAIVDFIPNGLSHVVNGIESMNNYAGTINTFNKYGKYVQRPDSKNALQLYLSLTPSEKLISKIRRTRKDIFLVGFKSCSGLTNQEMYLKGLNLLKKSSCNLVLVNDTKRRFNMIITPEEAAYHETDNRLEALTNLVDIAWHRSHLGFTQSTVKEGKPVPWNDPRVPSSLRTVVDYCIDHKAYKPFNGATVGHFATKLSDTTFLTSIRKSNFNDLKTNGLVYVETDGPDTVLAYGAKPSVGGQSQRIIFRDHEGMDCVVHFHCPLKSDYKNKEIKTISQREVECGSHQCGQNTSNGLVQIGNLKAVYLDKHGPNIVFNKNIDPQEVISFINHNFDLSAKTGGYNL